MEAHIQLKERVDGAGGPYRTSGNLLLDQVLGAALHPFPGGGDEAAADAAMERRSRRRAVSPTSSTPSRGIRRAGAWDAKLCRTFRGDSRIAGEGGA